MSAVASEVPAAVATGVRLEATGIVFGYDPAEPVVQDVSVDVRDAEVRFLLGHNGSGKSSLLGVLAGVLRAQGGRVRVGGDDLHALTPADRARRVGLVPQLHGTVFAYDVLDVVLMGRAPHLLPFAAPGRADREVALEALERVGLADFRTRRITELSGGERQLVMVARGLAQRCDVLLMDEPDAHLDPRNQFRVLEVVRALADEQGLAFVVASHAPNSALMFADRVLLLRKGRTLADGGVAETLTEPLLTRAYGMPTEVVTKVVDGRRMARAVLPKRIDRVAEGFDAVMLEPESIDRPGSVLAELVARGAHAPQRVIVTGARGAGKSRWCARLVELGRRRGWRVAGVASPARFEGRLKTGIGIVDLATGEERTLATLRRAEGDAAGPATERWRFDDGVLGWGNGALARAAEERADLLIVDELGPLEFHRDIGFQAGLSAMDSGRYALGCAVVRPSLLDAALARWPDALVVDVED
ncbi:MAG: ATP-binding cassette domain-containing protein [Trueperaceae bacterium]